MSVTLLWNEAQSLIEEIYKPITAVCQIIRVVCERESGSVCPSAMVFYREREMEDERKRGERERECEREGRSMGESKEKAPQNNDLIVLAVSQSGQSISQVSRSVCQSVSQKRPKETDTVSL